MHPDWKLREPPAELARRYLHEGWWDDRTLGGILHDGLRAKPAKPFTVRSDTHPWRGTLADVLDVSRHVAGGLRARGIGPGDVVAFQLPNWMEAAATFWATALLGAVVVPIVHFYGAKEVGYILRHSEARALITADRFGHLDYLATFERLRPELPALEWTAVVGNDVPGGLVAFDQLAAGEPVDGPVAVDPSEPALVAYTSGTTADPKGVVHTHRTIGFEIRQLGGAQAEDSIDHLVGAPVGHGIGMLAALLIPVHRGQGVHLIDVWDPGRVLAGMLEDRLTAGSGATYFLTSLLDHPDFRPEHLELMRHIGLGGSTIPSAVSDRATGLGISLVRMYGSTEHPSITGSVHEDPLEKRLYTDGHLLTGCELRLVDDDRRDVALGEPGEILSRGPDCFMGYTDPALTASSFDGEGWFATEDVGVLDADGYLSIVDRKKDIIIRGGENISALEVEGLLLRMAGVAEAAVVSAPDARLGEHACAFLRLLPSASAEDVRLDAIRAHLEACGLARQKWPEEVYVVDDFPRTASGKIQKFVLRARLRA